jgi:pimeloyl-ACP methyl ester carboxylesterase
MKLQAGETTVTLHGQMCRIRVWQRAGRLPRLLYLHGLGCDGQDAEMLLTQPALAGFAVGAPDLPGHGGTSLPAGVRLTLDDSVEVAHQVAGDDAVVLIGHSMGGTIGLLYAERHPAKCYINLEGNLAPENCHFSRESKRRTAEEFAGVSLPAYLGKLRASGQAVLQRYAETLAAAEPQALYDVGSSLVDYSDSGTLIERFGRLPMPKLYVHGDRNRGLTYLPALRKAGLPVIEIADSGHFPHLDNPKALASAIAEFIA